MNYTVPTKWSECNEYQLRNISKQLFSENKEVTKQSIELLSSLFISKKSWRQKIKFHWLLLSVSVKELLPYLSFLSTVPEVYHFPEIEDLKKPTGYLTSISIKQFSVVDKLFYDFWQTKDELKLRQMVATLYCIDEFEEDKLVDVAEITDKHPELWHRVFLAYISCRNYIVKKYPRIFPPEKEKNPDIIVPEFKKKKSYVPFNEVIVAMAFDDPQPLGPYAQAKETKIYEFLNVFNSSLIRQEKLEKENAKRK